MTTTEDTMDQEKAEIITLREALSRVGLEGLVEGDKYKAEYLVGWTGTPKMFSCGHDSVRGFGPTRGDHGETTRTDERIYQERVRVCQALCSGQVLFGWGLYANFNEHGGSYRTAHHAYVVIDTPPDDHHPVLKLAISA